MASYKVPLDVEADDKILGPFSFRQFVYLIVVALGLFMAWLLSKIFIGLVILPLPVVILFGALALPLRKDQPMETYLLAMVRFFLKPRRRLWQPDGSVSMVQIIAPRSIEETLTKGLSGSQARDELGYLARLMDSRGWAAKGLSGSPATGGTSLVISDADISTDVLDERGAASQTFQNLIDRGETRRRQEQLAKMEEIRRRAAAPTPTAEPEPDLTFNPYPQAMRQQVVAPADRPAAAPAADANPAKPAQTAPETISRPAPEPPAETAAAADPAAKTVTDAVSPDIINLALTESNNLSISTLAKEARRLQDKDSPDELVVNLR